MSKRTPENCSLIKRMGEPGTDANGKCMGFGREEADDEPCEPCKRCRGFDGDMKHEIYKIRKCLRNR